VDHGVQGLAGFDRGEIGRGDGGPVREVFVGKIQATLGLIDHVVKIVFERNAGHAEE
jgi:hypothetical protein